MASTALLCEIVVGMSFLYILLIELNRLRGN